MKRLSKLAKPFAVILLCIQIASCSLTSSAGIDATFCDAARPIYWSKGDTPGTVGQVKEHNGTGHTLCGWGIHK